jgi:hypothetical protein
MLTIVGQSGTTGVASGGYSNPHSANTGLHGSNVANTTDPRVDSNRSMCLISFNIISSLRY